ncbi:hypothetical protein KSS87_020886, partial [Heliosperma pusillum]
MHKICTTTISRTTASVIQPYFKVIIPLVLISSPRKRVHSSPSRVS